MSYNVTKIDSGLEHLLDNTPFLNDKRRAVYSA